MKMKIVTKPLQAHTSRFVNVEITTSFGLNHVFNQRDDWGQLYIDSLQSETSTAGLLKISRNK